MTKSLEGRVAIVTGAGRGIGRAIAIELASQGAQIVAVSRTLTEISETVQLIQEKDGQAMAVKTNVADHEAVVELVDDVLKHHGRIDILVNNAGIQGPIGPLVTNDWRAWQQNIQVNLFGTFNCCQGVLPTMINQRAGKIINLSGGGATAPRPNFSAYSASKAAIVRLTETLSEEVREHNIQVNAVAPGAVNTRMLEEVLKVGDVAGVEHAAAVKRKRDGGTSLELAARLVTFLASDASTSLTGKLIAAPYDDWTAWDDETMINLSSSPWLSLRRIDPFTLAPLTPSGLEQNLVDNL
jgi:3-oxoacyl-[acyl-carrier protein] reductase